MKIKTLTILIVCLSITTIYSQTITFNKRLNFGYSSLVFTGLAATDSCLYVSGVTRLTPNAAPQTLFAKFNLTGDSIFHVTYPSAQSWRASLQVNTNRQLEMAPYVIDSIGFRGAIYTVDALNGSLVEQKFYDNPFTPGHLIRPDGIIQTSDTGHVVISSVDDGLGAQLWIMKLNKKGEIEHDVIMGNTSLVEHMPTILSDSDSSYVIGYMQDNLSSNQSMNYTVRSIVKRLDHNFNTIWSYQSPNNHKINGVHDVIQTQDKGFAVASAWGYEEISGSGTFSTYYHYNYLYKLNQFGQLVWDKVFHSNQYDVAAFNKVIELPDSSLVAFGNVSRVYPAPVHGIELGRIVKVAPNGDSLWNREYECLNTFAAKHTINDAAMTRDGGFVAVGESTGAEQRGWLLKIDEQGCLVPGCHLITSTAPNPKQTLDLHIYPNPTTKQVQVYYPYTTQGDWLEWRLSNLQGQVIQQYLRAAEGPRTYIFDLQELPSGIYTLQLHQDGRLIGSEQIVKH